MENIPNNNSIETPGAGTDNISSQNDLAQQPQNNPIQANQTVYNNTQQGTPEPQYQAQQGQGYNQQGYTPNFVPPVYNNQYIPTPPPMPQYAPGAYTPPVQQYNPQAYTPYPQVNYIPSPQYHYADPAFNINFNNSYYQEHQKLMEKRKQAEKKIKNIGNISGAALIACYILSYIFLLVLSVLPAYEMMTENLTVSSFINTLFTLFVVGVPFAVFNKFYKGKDSPSPIENNSPRFSLKFNAPKNKLQALLLIIISFGGCMFANYFSSILIGLLEMFGITSTYSAIEYPKSAVDLIMMCISTIFMAALIEEFALRGVVLSNLRRYGNGFTIIASAIMFGIFHGNATQIPFATICGLFFAYSVIATESIWTGIIIHALNNSLSCISSVILEVADETASNTFFTIVSLGGIALAIICVFIYYALYRNDGVMKYKGEADVLTTGQKVCKFLSSPLMIIAIVLNLLQAVATLDFK